MKFLIVTSRENIAGMNIMKRFKEISDEETLILEKFMLFEDNFDEKLDKNYDFIIFASTHKSEKPNKTLSVHAPGNWRKAELGGKEGRVCKTSAFFVKHLFQTLNKEAENQQDYKVTMEATHHGPYIETPCCFIEIGSSEKEWKDEKAVNIIAETIKKAIESFDEKKAKKEWISAIGIGGPHYTPNFNKVQLNSKYAIGQVIQEYALPLTREMLKEAIEKTIENPRAALLDWKGLGRQEEKSKTLGILEQSGLKVIRTSQIEK